MKSNPLYDGDPRVWESQPLAAKLEWIRKHLCTGPCGASMQVANQRTRIANALDEAIQCVDSTD